MKKILAMLLVAAMVLTFAGCASGNPENTKPNDTKPSESTGPKFDPAAKEEGSMTYAQYAAAKVDDKVVVECYVQATQGWWSDNGQGKISVYAQSEDGAYFIYELACAEEDAAKKSGYIALLVLAKEVLESCIDVLGFEAPERM